MEINRNGRGCHQKTLPTTAKTTKQKQPKQAKTLANLMEIKGNGRGMPQGPLPQTTKTIKQKQQKSPKPTKTNDSDGNQ